MVPRSSPILSPRKPEETQLDHLICKLMPREVTLLRVSKLVTWVAREVKLPGSQFTLMGEIVKTNWHLIRGIPNETTH